MITANSIHQYIPHNTTLIIGLSGGPDSVALFLLLKDLQKTHNLKLIAAHLDHEWRAESYKDATWCQQLCKQHNIEIIVTQASQLKIPIKYNGSQEEVGRKLRRFFFKQCLEQYPQAKIVLAHHLNDQIETFFIRLARGSSITGLAGMKTQDKDYIRPMLHISKNKILDYLKHHQISFLQDPTNNDSKYLRNRIRHNLTAHLNAIDSRFEKNITAYMQHLQDTNDCLDQLTRSTLQQISTSQGIDINSFLNLHKIIQQRILLHLLIQAKIQFQPSSGLLLEIIRFLRTSKQKQHFIAKHGAIIKENQKFFIVSF